MYSPNLSKSDCMSDVARICSIITFHLSKLWKVKFSILWCHISCEAAGEFWHWSLSGVKGLNRGIPKDLLLLSSPLYHIIFADSMCLHWGVWNTNLNVYCSSLDQGKKLQHFLSDRVAKWTSFVSWTGSGFRWVSQTPLPKFRWGWETLING